MAYSSVLDVIPISEDGVACFYLRPTCVLLRKAVDKSPAQVFVQEETCSPYLAARTAGSDSYRSPIQGKDDLA